MAKWTLLLGDDDIIEQDDWPTGWVWHNEHWYGCAGRWRGYTVAYLRMPDGFDPKARVEVKHGS